MDDLTKRQHSNKYVWAWSGFVPSHVLMGIIRLKMIADICRYLHQFEIPMTACFSSFSFEEMMSLPIPIFDSLLWFRGCSFVQPWH